MAFFSTLFWVSFFMQDVQALSSLEVGVRLLPQAVTGLLLSPVIGFWMHRIPNQFILVAAAVCQIGAGVLLLFLRGHSNYFMYVFPSLVLSTLSMDWVRNVGAVSLWLLGTSCSWAPASNSRPLSYEEILTPFQQYIVHVLPLGDQIVGAAILQMVTRLGIPLGMGITTVIWSTTEHSYDKTFIAIISFAAVALFISSFARIGKLGIASTTNLPSSSADLGRLPPLFRHSTASLSLTDSIFKNLNHDGPVHIKGKRLSQLIQPRSSSLPGARLWSKRTSKRASSAFGLPQIKGSRVSGMGVESSDDAMDECRRLSQIPQRTSTAMAARVIWLVCEDCGSSKRIVESVGDPDRYFYDASGVKSDEVVAESKEIRPRSSVFLSVDDDSTAVNSRQFPLLSSPDQSGS